MKDLVSRWARALKSPWVTTVYMAGAVAFLAYYLWRHWPMARPVLHSATWVFLFYAFLFGCMNLMAYAYVAYGLYRQSGAKVTYWQILGVVLVSRLGVYLPGRIWYAANFYFFSRRLNVSAITIGQTFGLMNLFLFLTGAVCSLPIILPLLGPVAKILFLVGMLTGFVLVYPRCMGFVLSRFPKIEAKIRDRAPLLEFTSGLYAKLILSFFGLWLLAGAKLYFCVLALTPVMWEDSRLILAASAASLILGMAAIFAPGGIGVREGVGAFVLSSIMPAETALLTMLLSRLLAAVTELGAGLPAFYLMSRRTVDSREEIQKNPI